MGSFSPAEVQEVVDIGYLNGLFVLARSIGLIGAVGGWVGGWAHLFVLARPIGLTDGWVGGYWWQWLRG